MSNILPKNLPVQDLAQSLLYKEPLLKEKIITSTKMKAELVDRAMTELVKFLSLCAYYKKSLTPSHSVDLVWHEFILFTKCYEAFCKEHFGRFVHHQPDSQKEVNSQRFRNTLALYHLNFGNTDQMFWPKEESDCGACQNNEKK